VRPKKSPTPLIAAIYAGNTEAVDLLLRSGADTQLKDAFGNTPAEIARVAGRTDILGLLQAAQTRTSKR
jgi:ankyrin repeat protein